MNERRSSEKYGFKSNLNSVCKCSAQSCRIWWHPTVSISVSWNEKSLPVTRRTMSAAPNLINYLLQTCSRFHRNCVLEGIFCWLNCGSVLVHWMLYMTIVFRSSFINTFFSLLYSQVSQATSNCVSITYQHTPPQSIAIRNRMLSLNFPN